MARAYRRPALGLDGAGEGGKLCPSRSTRGKGFLKALADEGPLCPEPGDDIIVVLC